MTRITLQNPRLNTEGVHSPGLLTIAPDLDEEDTDVVEAADEAPKNARRKDLGGDLGIVQRGTAPQLNLSRRKITTARLMPEPTISSSWKDKPTCFRGPSHSAACTSPPLLVYILFYPLAYFMVCTRLNNLVE